MSYLENIFIHGGTKGGVKLEVNVNYVVTKGIKNGTIRTGDHIRLEENGDLLCRELGGWISRTKVANVMKGVNYEKDLEYYKNKIEKYQKKIDKLKEEVDKGC